MDLLKQFKGIFIETLDDKENITEYIDLLIERLTSSHRVEDQIEAIRALISFAKIKKYQIEVGAKTLDPLVRILENQNSNEIISLALECLKYIVSSNESFHKDEKDHTEVQKFDSQFSEIFLKDIKNLAIVIKLTEEYDFSIKYMSLLLFKALLVNAPNLVQTSLLKIENGISKILDLLDDSREVIRNEALISLVFLSKGNQDLQKIIAFENGFEIIFNILKNEDFSNGGVISNDCLKLLYNMLATNPSNLMLFREQNYIHQIMCPFFDSIHQQDLERDFKLTENINLNGSQENLENSNTLPSDNAGHKPPQFELNNDLNQEKISNITLMLRLIKIFVTPTLNPSALASAQKLMHKSGLLQKITDNVLMASGIPSNLLIQAILTTGQIIKGCPLNQEYFSTLMAPSNPPRYLLDILINSMLNENKPLRLRRTILHFFHSYLYRNAKLQLGIVSSLFTNQQQTNLGHTLVNALFTIDDRERASGSNKKGSGFRENLNIWFAAMAFSYTLTMPAHTRKSANVASINKNALNNPMQTNDPSSTTMSCTENSRAAKDTLLKVRLQTQLFDGNNQENQNKKESTANQDLPFMDCILQLLKKTKNLHSKIGLLVLLCQWLTDSPSSVKYLLANQQNVIFLITQITNEHVPTHASPNVPISSHSIHDNDLNSNDVNSDILDSENTKYHVIVGPKMLSDIIQSLAAFCYGLCMYFIADSLDEGVTKGGPKAQQDTLKGIVSKRLGVETYVNKLMQITKFEGLMIDQNIEALFTENFNNITESYNIQTLCILDQEFSKTYHFYETFILKLFDNPLIAKDDYKLDQIDFVTNKYQTILKEKDIAIKDLGSKCDDYKKQMAYLASKYEELNIQMKTMAEEQEKLKNTAVNSPQPPPVYQPHQVPYYPTNNQPYPVANQWSSPVAHNFNNSHDSTYNVNPHVYGQIPMLAHNEPQHPFQQPQINMYAQSPPYTGQVNQNNPAGYPPGPVRTQDFYMNDVYYDSNTQNFTLTNVKADSQAAQKSFVQSPEGDKASVDALKNIDLSEINAPTSTEFLKLENEKLKAEIAKMKETLAHLQREQEGFMILIEDYETKLDYYGKTQQPMPITEPQQSVNDGNYAANIGMPLQNPNFSYKDERTVEYSANDGLNNAALISEQSTLIFNGYAEEQTENNQTHSQDPKNLV